MKPSIKLDRVSKIYTTGQIDVAAINDVSFEIPSGEFLVLLGPSGSGKTTLLNLIGGLDYPTVGRIEVNGFEVSALNRSQMTQYRRTQIGFIFQTFNLIPTLTAKENVEFAAELVKNRRSTEELLESVGLGNRMNHFPSELSGGENQRVAIARSLATDPHIILCDEPTGSLDFETGKRIFKLIRELNRTQHKTVVIVTHNSPIGQIADRIIKMRDGRIVESITNPHPLDPERLEW